MTAGGLQYGGDISVYQPAINYPDKDFWFIKITEGVGFRDARATQHWNGAGAAGRIRGGYHFARPDLGNSPEAEARWHSSQVVYSRGEMHALDWEVRYSDPVGWVLRYLREMKRLQGVTSGVYMNQSTLQGYNWTPVANEGFWLWIAAYDLNPGLALFRWWSSLAFKQYWNSPYDLDSFFGTLPQLQAFVNQEGNVDMPLSADFKEGVITLAYYALIGRGPGSEAEAQQWAVQLGDNGENFWAVLGAIRASDEAKNYQKQSPFGPDPAEANPGPAARLDMLEAKVTGLAPGTVGQHTHPVNVTGTSGPAGP